MSSYSKREHLLPSTPLLEALELVKDREERMENPSLGFKLHGEFAKPRNSGIRKAAADAKRIPKLKAKDSISPASLAERMH